MLRETIPLEGDLLGSDLLRRLLAAVAAAGGEAEIVDLRATAAAGATAAASARLVVGAKGPAELDRALAALAPFDASRSGGVARIAETLRADARTAPAEADGILPDEFHASISYATFVRCAGEWRAVREQKMDCAIVLRDGVPTCVKQRLVRRGEPVVLRGGGIRVELPERTRGPAGFAFMSNEVSTEVNKAVVIAGVARTLERVRAAGERIVLVAGPAIIHSGGDGALIRLVRAGWIDVVLSGNAFAAHDLEKALVGTSLGVCQKSGRPMDGGSRNHLFAINAVNRAGGIAAAVASGLVRSGVMFELVQKRVPFVLAGSIRDDGPLKDVVSDTLAAQLAYVRALEGAGACLMLASALHSIAVGNLLPARVATVCVDMTEALPVKLGNRGTMHAVGIVTDVGYFLERLATELKA